MRAAAALAAFLNEDQGQDLVEYSLLMAFFVLVGAALYIGLTDSINGIWTGISNRLANTD